jgi:glycosyltransferase involved in cell wall biosynthesis
MRSLTILIPVRNEREAIPPLFTRFAEAASDFPPDWELLLVDGCSSDGTPALAETWADRLPVRVHRLSENRGLGGALEAGLLEAIDQAKVIVTMDGDDSHEPHTNPTKLGMICEGADKVIASPCVPGGVEVGVAG